MLLPEAQNGGKLTRGKSDSPGTAQRQKGSLLSVPFMKTNLFQARLFSALALGIGCSFGLGAAAGREVGSVERRFDALTLRRSTLHCPLTLHVLRGRRLARRPGRITRATGWPSVPPPR